MLSAKYLRRLYMLHQKDTDEQLKKSIDKSSNSDEAKFICDYILKERNGMDGGRMTELLIDDNKETRKESIKELKEILAKMDEEN